eukprot:gnl/Spiro4/26085_TR13010_c0_g1_i1.p1 gnl/Spiro4/26085_TR13010_c0_g1~~gnl/Spiro4/26085_TR13010_c0_g1_i1.p1  ORF type:complete len:183 (+),score=7.65 gnl/Spiro4/26085_TR13010_c0_g1_i1:89-637(+)
MASRAKRAKRTGSMTVPTPRPIVTPLFTEKPSRHLFCVICNEIFHEPHRAKCGHSFCYECISTWLARSETCPTCRAPLRLNKLHRDLLVQNIVNELRVYCQFRREGCEWTDEYVRFPAHVPSCIYNPANLPEWLAIRDPSIARPPPPAIVDSDEEVETETPLRLRLYMADEATRELLREITS